MREAAGELFLVWGPPSHGPRSKVFARELGIPIEFVNVTERRGALVAPYKYALQAWRTTWLLRRRRPQVVFVQSPPNLAVLAVWTYAAIVGASFVVDAHSDAMLSPWWTRPRWLHRAMMRHALATIVTNAHFAAQLEEWGARVLVISDIPTAFGQGQLPDLPQGFHVLAVNTFSSDEPLAEIIEAARLTPEATFHITGRSDRHPEKVPVDLPPNVHFTGFLPDEAYFALMGRVDAVMCLTTRDNTMQRGACEALSVGRPIITSDWPLLRSYFTHGTVHVVNTTAGIAAGVREAQSLQLRLEVEIAQLKKARMAQWMAARDQLRDLVESTTPGLSA